MIALKDGLIEPEHLGLTFQSTARDLTKDPYSFEFLSLTDDYHEKELKDALIDNIEKFLMELGKGFTYVGREYPVDTGEKIISSISCSTTSNFIAMSWWKSKPES